MSLSGVCQAADTDANGTVDAALPVGNTDEPNIPVTRGQNFTHPKRTTSQPKPQQPLKGVKSLSSLLFFSFLLLLISHLVFSSFSSHLISFLLLVLCLLHSSLFLFCSHLVSSPLFYSHLIYFLLLFFLSSCCFVSSPVFMSLFSPSPLLPSSFVSSRLSKFSIWRSLIMDYKSCLSSSLFLVSFHFFSRHLIWSLLIFFFISHLFLVSCFLHSFFLFWSPLISSLFWNKITNWSA